MVAQRGSTKCLGIDITKVIFHRLRTQDTFVKTQGYERGHHKLVSPASIVKRLNSSQLHGGNSMASHHSLDPKEHLSQIRRRATNEASTHDTDSGSTQHPLLNLQRA